MGKEMKGLGGVWLYLRRRAGDLLNLRKESKQENTSFTLKTHTSRIPTLGKEISVPKHI